MEQDDTDMALDEFDRLFEAGEPVQMLGVYPTGLIFYSAQTANVEPVMATTAHVVPSGPPLVRQSLLSC